MIESTNEYYENKADFIFGKLHKKITDNHTDFEGFINTPFSKSMLRVKFEYDLESKGFTEEDIIELTIEQGLSSIIYSGLIKTEITKERQSYLSNQIPSSAHEIKDYLDYIASYNYKDIISEQMESIKYLYFGEKFITFIPYILDDFELKDGYVGTYKGIKFFYIEMLEDIYMTNHSYIDLNTTLIKYNEYIREEYDDLFTDEIIFEKVPNKMKRGVMTLNCIMGDVKMLKIKCHFGLGKMFMRKVKLQRILKNDFEI